MKLHHGTNTNFDQIRLDKCLPHKDFGRGFYLTPNKRKAKLRALDKVDKEHRGIPTILSNRSRKNRRQHDYDIVIGPVADDGVITAIALYESKVIDRKELLKRIKDRTSYIQYTFCTQKAIDKLQRI